MIVQLIEMQKGVLASFSDKWLLIWATNDLVKRWSLRSGTLTRWRQYGTEPAFLKFGKAVRYRIEDVIEYEQRSLKIPPTAEPLPD